jgi:hypothetical protein
MDEKGRHEHKLNINYSDYMQLSSRLRHIAKFDENALDDGSYIIRSLYFDNYADKAVVEKLSGASRREKFRIRFYNDDPSFIRLEKKSKANRLCYKKNAPITVEQCEGILAGNWGLLKESGQELLMELYTKMHYQNLRPRTIVDYKRETYVYHAGNVRITFDSNIRTSNNVSGLFNPELVTIPAASAIVLEIKYDGFIPEIIRQLVRVDSRNETEFSKYVVSRLI